MSLNAHKAHLISSAILYHMGGNILIPSHKVFSLWFISAETH